MGNILCSKPPGLPGRLDRDHQSCRGWRSWAASLIVAGLAGWGLRALLVDILALPLILSDPIPGSLAALGALLTYEFWPTGRGASNRAASASPVPRDWVIWLVREHGLTLAEAGICAELSRGLPRAHVAGRLRITSGTLKCHLRKIYAKTIERQLEDATDDRDKLHRLTAFLRDLKEEWRDGSRAFPSPERVVPLERGWARTGSFPDRTP